MANLLLKRIKDWATSITSFRTGDVIPVDGPSGTAKMSKDDLLRVTAQNALGSIKNLTATATDSDLKAGNYLALDCAKGTKRLSAEMVSVSSITYPGALEEKSFSWEDEYSGYYNESGYVENYAYRRCEIHLIPNVMYHIHQQDNVINANNVRVFSLAGDVRTQVFFSNETDFYYLCPNDNSLIMQVIRDVRYPDNYPVFGPMFPKAMISSEQRNDELFGKTDYWSDDIEGGCYGFDGKLVENSIYNACLIDVVPGVHYKVEQVGNVQPTKLSVRIFRKNGDELEQILHHRFDTNEFYFSLPKGVPGEYIMQAVRSVGTDTFTRIRKAEFADNVLKECSCVYGENLFNVTISGGFYDGSGNQTANVEFDSCQLVLKPGTTYKVINQITDNGNNIRLFGKSETGYKQLKVWQTKDPLIFTSPFDSTKEYMLQVVRDLRFANYPEIYEYNFAGEVLDVAKLANRKRKIKILAIGNSYSRDNYSYVPKLMENLADVDVTFGILYKGSCTLKQHFGIWNVEGDYPAYDKYTTSAGRWTTTNTYNCVAALNEENWDIITLQQQSSDSRDYNTFQPYLNDLHNLLLKKSSHNFKLAWLMTMAYPTGYSGLGSDTSDGMFAKIVSAAKAAMNGSCLEFLIPCGTATQNARHTSLDSLGDFGHLSYEGLHLQEGVPCLISNYVAALVFLEKMGFGYKGINANKIRPTQVWINHLNIPEKNGYSVGVSDVNCLLAQKCALYAMKKPFEITEGIV